jgi:hypothetical protein
VPGIELAESRKSDVIAVCIRDTGEDAFGPPRPESAACGRRLLRA